MKKFLSTLFILLCVQFSSIFALTANYQDEDVNISLIYTDTLIPGDAIFVRMTVQTPKSVKRSKDTSEKSAVLKLYQGTKNIETASFYKTDKQFKSGATELLAGVPLSTWLVDNDYVLKVIFNLSETDAREFTLPITFQNREFEVETVYLNKQNTSIRTDNSPERAAQIEKLNNILFTINPESVFHLKQFSNPSTATYYTSHFGDRRTYQYSNGKTSTTLHYGNDYRASTGTPLNACASGKVVLAEWRNSTGYSIVIEHLPGLYSIYYHLSELETTEGKMVKAGELIGKSGATGLATGPHIHWEIRLNGEAVRPEYFTTNFAFDNIEY